MSSGLWKMDRALTSHSHTLTSIAFAATRHWGYPERWIESWSDVLTITPEYIHRNEVYAAFVESGPVAFYSLAEEGDGLALDHLWVSPEWIGRGVGRALFEHAVRRGAALGAEVLRIESDPNAEGFYRRMGARRVGENVHEVDGRERTLPLLEMSLETPQ